MEQYRLAPTQRDAAEAVDALPLDDRLAAVREALPTIVRGGYFNSGYTGPLCRAAHVAMLEQAARELDLGRMGADHRAVRDRILDDARRAVADLIGARPGEVALTHHTTEGMNLVAHGIAWQPGDNAVTTQVEHKGGLLPLEVLRRRRGVESRPVAWQPDEPMSELTRRVIDAIDDRTRLVALSHVSYVNGAILDLEPIVSAAHRHGALVCVDGAQAVGVLPVDVKAIGADAYAVSGQKWLCGPEDTGALYVDPAALDRIALTYVGYASVTTWDVTGGFEPNPDVTRFEVGTRSTALIAGFAAAIRWLAGEVGVDWAAQRTFALAELARQQLRRSGLTVLTPDDHVGLVAFRTPVDPDTLVERLAERGITARSIFGYDCVRVSIGHFHIDDEVTALVDTVVELSRDEAVRLAVQRSVATAPAAIASVTELAHRPSPALAPASTPDQPAAAVLRAPHRLTVVHPLPALRGSVRVPSSKPHCQRAFLFAALANGRSRIRRLNTCSETNLVADACAELGAGLAYDGDTVTIDGIAGRPRRPEAVLRTAGSGFALRNLLAMSALGDGPTIFAGDHRLAQRPLTPLVDALHRMGTRVEPLDPRAALPLVSWGGGIRGGTLDVPADETSQFVTALLLVAPYATEVTRLRLPEPIVGHHYISMTLAMMRDFGASVDASDDLTEIVVRPGGYVARDTCIGPDATSLFYFIGAAVVTDADLRVDDVRFGVDPFLDSAIELGRELGVRIVQEGDGVRITSGPPPASQVVVDATDVPTLVPALAAIAPSLPAGMRLTGADHLRHHKTSRLDVLMTELAQLGRCLEPIYSGDALDGFVSAGVSYPTGDQVDSHGDHRLFMALYLASLATDQVTKLRGHETLVTSFSDFLECFDTLRASAPHADAAVWAPAPLRDGDFELTTTEATA